jgi:hypothetical protein
MTILDLQTQAQSLYNQQIAKAALVTMGAVAFLPYGDNLSYPRPLGWTDDTTWSYAGESDRRMAEVAHQAAARQIAALEVELQKLAAQEAAEFINLPFDQRAALLIVNSAPDSEALSAAKAARRFFVLAHTAASHGGFWVSAAGGTANVVAGEIARAIGVSFAAAHRALDAVGGSGWYQDLAEMQPWPIMEIPYDHDTDQWLCRWDARTIARAAVRPLRQSA